MSLTGLESIRRKVTVAYYQHIDITDQVVAETTLVVSKSSNAVDRLNVASHNEGQDIFAHHVRLVVHRNSPISD